jgi:hypothetical protein
MNILIRHLGYSQEVELIEAYCRWQNIGFVTERAPPEGLMSLTKGRRIPVICQDEKVVAVGFHEFLEFLKASGMIQN